MQIGGVFAIGIAYASAAYAGTCCFILNEIVADKETRMRETLRIMSLDRWSYALSFFITQGILAVFTSIILFVAFCLCFSLGQYGIEKNNR